MKAHLLFVGLLLFGCATTAKNLDSNSEDGQAVAAVEQAWEEAGLPRLGKCFDGLDVHRHDTGSSFHRRCEGSSPGPYREAIAKGEQVFGCLTSRPGKGIRSPAVWTIEVAPEAANDMGLVQHEAIHLGTYCKLGRPRNDPFDALHTDPRLWTAASKDAAVRDASVQSRALLISHQGVLGGP